MILDNLTISSLSTIQDLGVVKISDFLKLSEEDLLNIKGFGSRRIQKLVQLQKNPKLARYSTLEELIILGNLPSSIKKLSKKLNTSPFELLTYGFDFIHSEVRLTKKERTELFNLKVKKIQEKYNNTLSSSSYNSNSERTDDLTNKLITEAAFENFIKLDNNRFNNSQIKEKISKHIEIYSLKNVNPNYFDELIPLLDISYALKINDFIQLVIIKALKSTTKPMLIHQLKLKVLKYIKVPTYTIQEFLGVLQHQGFVQYTEKGVLFQRPKISIYLQQHLDEFEILFYRFKGYTLQEIGDWKGLSRERIRQLENGEKKKLPINFFHETQFLSYYEQYDFSEKMFLFVFKLSNFDLEFLKSFANSKKKKIDHKTLLKSDSFPLQYKERLRTYLDRDIYYIDGQKVKKQRDDILAFAIKRFAMEPIQLKEFYNLFKQFLDDYNIEYTLSKNKNSFFTSIASLDHVIVQPQKVFRFYPMDEIDIKKFIKEIDFSLFMNKYISARIIFITYRELCKQYDIRNEYELHHILRKYSSFSPFHKYLTFTKMPHLSIGKSDIHKQILDVLYEHSPVSKDDFALICSNRFGFKPSTLKATYFRSIEKYLVDDIYSIDAPHLNSEIVENLKKILTKEFYLKEDVENLYKEKYGDSIQIQDYYFKKIGFRSFAVFILDEKYPRADLYFKEKHLSEDVFTIPDKRLVNVRPYKGTIEEMESNLELFEYTPNNYVSLNRIQEVFDIDKKDFLNFIETVSNHVQDNYFTVDSIEYLIDDSPLNQLGFDNWFFASLLKREPRFRYQNIGGNVVLKQTKEKFFTYNFINDLMFNWESINIYDFMDYLKDKFNINLEKEKIIQAQDYTELYYNETIERLFQSEEHFYEFLKED